jgi:uncharacterized protein YdhG (YjbR/CyaY superfamily)
VRRARTGFTSVDDYLAAQPPPTRAALERVRATVRKALPRATEGISYQIPVYEIDGRMVLYFAGYAKHYAIYPATQRLLAELGEALEGRVHGKATIRFPVDVAVPTGLVTRIARLLAAEAKPAKPRARKAPAKKR